MKRFLSVDFDYFPACGSRQRGALFPRLDETDAAAQVLAVWQDAYARSSGQLVSIGVIPAYYRFLGLFADFGGDAAVAESHAEIVSFILKNTKPDEVFEVRNVDFHHDRYCLRSPGSRYSCANWAEELLLDRPGMRYDWTAREDSETALLGGGNVQPAADGIEEVLALRYDFIFLCRSGIWSPPHLDGHFALLARALGCEFPPERAGFPLLRIAANDDRHTRRTT